MAPKPVEIWPMFQYDVVCSVSFQFSRCSQQFNDRAVCRARLFIFLPFQILATREIHTPVSAYVFSIRDIVVVPVYCKVPLFSSWSRHAAMLHVDEQFVGHAMHALTLRLVCQVCLHVIVCPGRL